MCPQILCELVAVEPAARVVTQVLGLNNTITILVMVRLSSLMSGIPNPTVRGLISQRSCEIDLL